jgi:peptide/nickel transport system substrate-binding protein
MTIRLNKDIANFDPYFNQALTTIESAWMERMFTDDWTMDPAVWDYRISFRPNDFIKGQLAESWEFTDPSTLVVHLRKGIHWQNISPANGREFIADDVAFHFNRLYGLGGGFTKVSPYQAAVVAFQSLVSVTATDKYTVVFKWNTSSPEFINETLHQVQNSVQCLENPDAVKLWGDVSDWHHAIGTGPFILTDFVSGSSATLIKNPNYWGYDERYPQNHLPYVDKLSILIIPDNSTALAGLRTGKIDLIDTVSLQDAQSMQKTNPEILQITVPAASTLVVDPRNDVKPFNDIRVREAMQMAIDLPTIASTYYGGLVSPEPSTLTSDYLKGWGFPYDQWPQDLKDQYAYNPTAAKQLLADAGYPKGFNTDVVADNSGDMGLLQIVKSYFAAVGINMDIRAMDPASWATFVQTSHKYDQLAFRSIGLLGRSFEPGTQLTLFQTGSSFNYQMISDPVFDAFYAKFMAAISIDDVKQVVKDANEYVAQHHFLISLLPPVGYSLYQPWLKGYNGQYISISAVAGPSLLYFYPARFWIDQNLKKSLGH